MRLRAIPPGSYSSGSLRPEDVIPAYLEALSRVRLSRLDRNTVRGLDSEFARFADDDDSAASGDTLADILDTLDNIAGSYTPPGHYFGSHPGDGADIGCWPSEDVPAVEAPVGVMDGETNRDYRARFDAILDAADRKGIGNGTVFEVSDHGNILGVWERSCTGDAKLDRWRRFSL